MPAFHLLVIAGSARAGALSIVVPRQFALGRAHEAFDGSGALQDAKTAEAVAGVVRALMQVATALRSTQASLSHG